MPCLFILLSYGLYLLAGTPIEHYISTQIYAAIEMGNPDYQFILPKDKELVNQDQDTKETVKTSEIKNPSVGEQYGMITCKDIDLRAPLYFGDTDEILEDGVGQYAKSKMPGFGGCILVGGHDSTFFAPLETIEVGQKVVINTEYGAYTYEVRETKVVKTEDIAACRLESEEEQLVLYTCYPFGKVLRARDERYFVYCDKVSGPIVEED
ncbi:MAG: class D sortase [Velocimicrobium sp.]